METALFNTLDHDSVY